MLDYYTHVNGLPEDKLYDEIEKLTKQLFNAHVGSPMYNQIMDMLDQAHSAQNDMLSIRMLKAQNKGDLKDGVIDIGEIESETTTPNYSSNEILNAVVDAYTTGSKL